MTLQELSNKLTGKQISIGKFNCYCARKGTFVSFTKPSPVIYMDLSNVRFLVPESLVCKQEDRLEVAYEGKGSKGMYNYEIIQFPGDHYHIITWAKQENDDMIKLLHVELIVEEL